MLATCWPHVGHILPHFGHILPHVGHIFSWHRILLTIFFGTSSPDCDPDTHPSAPSEFARRSGGSSPRFQTAQGAPHGPMECDVELWFGQKLVGGFNHHSEKYEFVSWDDDIPNIWKNRTCSKAPTSPSLPMIRRKMTLSSIPGAIATMSTGVVVLIWL